tara:strand:- start:855 stop:1079 length:225 start_codon:yes stop_codon:yes gene_type:complete
MEDLEEIIKKVLLECPKNISTTDIAVLIANIINVYDFAQRWPTIVVQTTEMLKEHEAVKDAEEFLINVARGRMH